jgi:hypothetical protein
MSSTDEPFAYIAEILTLSQNGRLAICSLPFRRKYFLNTDLINQMLSAQIR